MPQLNVFISYAHEDREWLERLMKQLSVLRREGRLKPWSDKDLLPGDQWESKIHQALEESVIAVLLVSADFLDSEFIMERELPVLLRRFQEGKLWKIMPLIVKPCNWKEASELKSWEARPKDNQRGSVLEGSSAEQEKDLAEFAREILNALRQRPASTVSLASDLSSSPALDQHGRLETDFAVLEINLSSRGWNRYNVELIFMEPASSAPRQPLRYSIPLDIDSFHGIADIDTYRRRLYDLLLSNDAHRAFVENARAAADRQHAFLRVRLAINACARQLNALHWEILGCGDPQNSLLSFQSTYLLRYAGADIRSWRDIRRRPKSSMTAALISVDLGGPGWQPSREEDFTRQHLQEAATVFRETRIQTSEPRFDLRIDDIREFLNSTNPDLLYLSVDCDEAPGATRGAEQAAAGWESLLQALKEVETAPRLVILAPRILPTDFIPLDRSEVWLPLIRLSQDIAETGVIGVLTTQTGVPLEPWTRFLLEFLRNLSRDGRLDHALHTARKRLEKQECQWAPIVISGVRTGRIWYVPHFTDEAKTATNWMTLIATIREGKCTPIIGPGLNSKVARARAEIALNWAENYHYPMALHERISLPRVSQYIASEFGDGFLYVDFEKQYREFSRRRFGAFLGSNQAALSLDDLTSEVAAVMFGSDPDEPHQVLAKLPFPLYVTASLNSFLSDALAKANRLPQEIVLGLLRDGQTPGLMSEPTSEKPLVYHLFGKLSDVRSSVLTEDDYFDFLIHFWRDKDTIPRMVRAKLANSSLIFLGFKMNDWDFRVLFRSLLEIEGSRLRSRYMHVAVQVDPDDDQVTDPERARNYLERYFARFAPSGADINIFWGSAEDFLRELNAEWEKTP